MNEQSLVQSKQRCVHLGQYHSNTTRPFSVLGLKFGEPSTSAEMHGIGSSLLAENGVASVLVLFGISRERDGMSSRRSDANIRDRNCSESDS